MHSNRQNGEEQVKFPYVLAWVMAQIWSQRRVELLMLSVQQSKLSCSWYWHKLLLSHKIEEKKRNKSKRLYTYDFSYCGPGEAGLDGIGGTVGTLLWTATSLHQ